MSKVHFTARFPNIEPENLEAFKKAAAEAVEAVRGETGNLQYDYFFNKDETVCIVRETYEDSQAVLSHMAEMSDLLPRLIDLGGGFEGECYGDPSPALADALAGLPTFSHFVGK